MKGNHTAPIRKLSLQQNKTEGYGGSPKKYADPFLPRFKVIYYTKGPYQAIDRYTGQEQNIGQAVYFYQRTPVYGLNYYGIAVTEKTNRENNFQFSQRSTSRRSREVGPSGARRL